MAAGLPANAQVGKRTVALMIDQALAAQQAKTGTYRGLKVMVALLTILVAGGLFAGAWYIVDRDRDDDDRRSRGPATSDPSSVGARIAATNEQHIYLLAMRHPDGRVRGFCTGFAVNENTLATNAHCVRMVTQDQARGAQLFALRNKGSGEMIPARAVYLDGRFQNAQASRGGAGYDVGLVQTEARLPGWVRLASDDELYAVREGDGVFVYGFPGMTMNERSPVATITLGLLNRVTDFFDNVATPPTAQKLQHSAQTSGGSSGSPIFLPSGAVIGVNAGSLSDEERQVVTDPTNGQRREVEVNRGSNFKYGMRADLIRQAMVSVNARIP
jgi:V8-like Glu-specific endopeptidase